jgi:hypothetical protein
MKRGDGDHDQTNGRSARRLSLLHSNQAGRLTTKIYAVVDAEGRPIALKLTEGQAPDGRSAQDMPGSVRPGGSRCISPPQCKGRGCVSSL